MIGNEWILLKIGIFIKGIENTTPNIKIKHNIDFSQLYRVILATDLNVFVVNFGILRSSTEGN